jgi:hypothetical protein
LFVLVAFFPFPFFVFFVSFDSFCFLRNLLVLLSVAWSNESTVPTIADAVVAGTSNKAINGNTFDTFIVATVVLNFMVG